MDYIYGNINNNLVTINRLEYVELRKCEVANEPIDGLAVGDFYLAFKVFDCEKLIYCSLAKMNQDVIDKLDTKVDKVSDSSAIFNRAYGVDTNGNQKMFNISKSPNDSALAQYTSEGKLISNDPVSALQVANKRYVDKAIENKELKNNIVDIVHTYTDLESYDTSNLTADDIIIVLHDETHDNSVSYYRWNTTFKCVGSEGPYYTQTQVDEKLDNKVDKEYADNNYEIIGLNVKRIPNDINDITDLNDLETAGVYDVMGKTLTNIPSAIGTEWFRIEVKQIFKVNDTVIPNIVQTIYCPKYNYTATRMRSSNSKNWSKWSSLSNKVEKVTKLPWEENTWGVYGIKKDEVTGILYEMMFPTQSSKREDLGYDYWIENAIATRTPRGTLKAAKATKDDDLIPLIQYQNELLPAIESKISENKTSVDTEINNIKADIDNIMSPNLYNEAEAKKNTAIDENYGNELSFDGWLATGYIPVTKDDVLYFSSKGEPISYSTGAFYDKNKQLVNAFGNPDINKNITVTSDGYARFSFGTSPVNLQIEKGSITKYVPYGELKIKADVNEIKSEVDEAKTDVSKVKNEVLKIQEDHTNIFNKDTVVKGAIFAENGYFDPSFSSWDTSDYIPVKPGMVLYFSSDELPIGVVSTGAYFDANKKYLSGVNNEPTTLTVPDGAYYLRFSKNGGLGDTLNTLKIEQYGITKFTPYGELYVTVNESALPSSILPKWKGLKILTLGDSITAMGGVNGWTYWIKQYLSADKVVNVSVAGSTWQDKVANQTYDGNPQPSTDGNVMGNQVQKVLNAKANGDADYQDFDVITFSFGTNDIIDFSVQTKESVEAQFITNYAQNNYTVVPLENVNRQTLAGAMRYGFQKLHEAYPNAIIFMCTPTQECYETFNSIYQKGDLINFVADRLGVETIDTRRCGIRNIYESQTTIDYDHPEQSGTAPIQTDLLDGIHTNENGAKKIAKYNARAIMKYFMID